MAKENTFYFTHDYNARSDKKIKRLLAKTGYLGYGLFWAIIEDLYNNSNELPLDYDSIAYDLKADEETVKSIINDFELFQINGNLFSSDSVQRRLNERNEKSNRARDSINVRWEKLKNNTNVLPPNNDSNTNEGDEKPPAVPKISSKEEKINQRLIREKVFYESLVPYIDEYGKEMIRAFYNRWSEPTPSGIKMKWELEKTWSVELRLKTWQRNDDKWNKSNKLLNNGNEIKTGPSESAKEFKKALEKAKS